MDLSTGRRALPVLLAFASSLACLSCSKPSPGMVELLASREAVRTAQSWQADTAIQLPEGFWVVHSLSKTECPARKDRTEILHRQQNRGVHGFWYDGIYYTKSEAAWTYNTDPQIAAVVSCGKGPQLESEGFLYDDLETVQKSGEVRPGNPAQQPDGSCTWWDVFPAKNGPVQYSVCVNQDDHLPRTARTLEKNLKYSYTFSNWNTTHVALPADLSPPEH
jgi:hypothetical protein